MLKVLLENQLVLEPLLAYRLYFWHKVTHIANYYTLTLFSCVYFHIHFPH